MREELLSRMISLYGSNSSVVARFKEAMNNPLVSTEALELVVVCHEKFPETPENLRKLLGVM